LLPATLVIFVLTAAVAIVMALATAIFAPVAIFGNDADHGTGGSADRGTGEHVTICHRSDDAPACAADAGALKTPRDAY
jgi:anthranilate phosphoribosyltransferase